MSDRPFILIGNDDGVRAPGIQALANSLREESDVILAAPDRERSAASHAISLDHPLRAEEIAAGVFAIDGTPVDCMYLALHHLVPRRPDLCLSGINNGFNLGSDLFYSGTVGAALEGALRGIPSIAFSLERMKPQDFSHAAEFAKDLVFSILARGKGTIPESTFLNVNIPAGPIRGLRPTSMGRRIYRDQVEVRADLRGRKYYWIGGPEVKGPDLPDSDCTAIADGLVSVTPIGLDLTHRNLLSAMASWWPDRTLSS